MTLMRVEARVTHVLEAVTIELNGEQAQRLQRMMADQDNGTPGGIAHDLNRKLVRMFEQYDLDHYTRPLEDTDGARKH